MRSRPTRRGSQKTEGINRETYHRIPPSLLSPTRTNLLLPRTLFADVVVKGETEASETREAKEREQRKKEEAKSKRCNSRSSRLENQSTKKEGGVQKNQHTEWIGKNWFEKKQEKQDTKSRYQNPGHVRREEGANTADWREESGDARREESEGRKERRQQSERREREKEIWRMSRCERQKRPASCAARVPASSARTSTFPSPPSPGQFNGHAGRGTAEWAAAQGGSYGFRTSGGQAGTPA